MSESYLMIFILFLSIVAILIPGAIKPNTIIWIIPVAFIPLSK